MNLFRVSGRGIDPGRVADPQGNLIIQHGAAEHVEKASMTLTRSRT
jgi:hypothetical protein